MEEDKAHFGPRKGKETADVQLRTFQAGGKIMDISYTSARGDTLSQNKYEKKSELRAEHKVYWCSKGHPESKNP